MIAVTGYQALLAWLQTFGTIVAVGVESTGAYGAGLTRSLRAAGVTVVEVNQPHPHTRSRRGKTDAIDAEAAARKVLAGEATVIPKDTTGAVEAIRHLQVAGHGAVKARSAALCQLGELITTAPADVRETLTSSRKTLEGQATLCSRFRPDTARLDDPVQAARFALRGVAQRIAGLRREVAAYDKQLDIRASPIPSWSTAHGRSPRGADLGDRLPDVAGRVRRPHGMYGSGQPACRLQGGRATLHRLVRRTH